MCRCAYTCMQIDVLRDRICGQDSPIVIPQGNNLCNCFQRKQTPRLSKLGAVPLTPVVPDEKVLKVKCMFRKSSGNLKLFTGFLSKISTKRLLP